MTMSMILTIVLLLAMAAPVVGQPSWSAPLEIVQRASESRPNLNFVEANVPDYELPDPLRRLDGTRVTTADEWSARRAEILELFREQVYGRSPGPPQHLSFRVVEEDPAALDGLATMRRVAIECGQGQARHTFELLLILPNGLDQPAPTFLCISIARPDHTALTRTDIRPAWPVPEAMTRGYALAAIHREAVSPDDPKRWREGVVGLFEGTDQPERPADAWGAVASWAWGARRAMDYLQTEPRVDARRIAVLGHSRCGKAALWTGAEDTRFALVISNNSGCSGAALSRRKFGETVAQINRGFPHWFAGNYHAYADREEHLPVDQHMLLALIAPRPLYVASADEDVWCDQRGEFLSLAHSSPVYGLWGEPAITPDAMPLLDQPLIAGCRGYHIRTGGHGLRVYDWQRYMDFADHVWDRAKPMPLERDSR